MLNREKQDSRIEVLELVRRHSRISRAELSRLTGLTRPTISAIAGELTALELIRETGKGESSGGKRPIMLELNNTSLHAIGIDLADEDCIRGVLCGPDGVIIHKYEEAYKNSFSSILTSTCKIIDNLLKQPETGKVRGIGISISGVVSDERNEVIHSSSFDLENKNLAQLVAEKFSLSVHLVNRPNAGALAEKIYGSGQRYDNLIYLTTGQGFGAGIIHNGSIFSGSYGAAGEIGKLIIDPGGPVPDYPNDRTLEYRVRANYILERIAAAGHSGIDYRKLLELFVAGDRIVEDKVYENAMFLAYGASILANIINPEVIILGGRIKEFGNKYFEFFREKFYELLMVPRLLQIYRTEVQVSEFGRNGIALGGAVLVLDKIFNLELSELSFA